MSYQLMLLGLLAERPHYGYEVKQIFEEGSFAEYVKISGGGLYYNLHKLVKEGYITQQTVEKEGNYPDRHVYKITTEGRKHLLTLLRDTFSDTKGRAFFDPLDAALLLGPLLPREEIIIRLQRHVDRLRARGAQLELIVEILGKVENAAEPYMLLLIEHSITRIRNDLAWLVESQRRISEDSVFKTVHENHKPLAARLASDEPPSLVELNPEGQQVWHDFESGLQKAASRYSARTEQAWREYETSERIFSNSDENLENARQDYLHKTEEAWQEYNRQLERQKAFISEKIEQARVPTARS